MSKRFAVPAFAAAVLIVSSAIAAEKAAAKASKPTAEMIAPEDLKWGPVPPKFPQGAQMAVLHGDPAKKGSEYALRMKAPDGYKIAPHWHPNDEQLTVISGSFNLGLGDKFDEAAMHALGPGAYHFLPKKMHHFALTKGETIIEVHGVGPFGITYLNPADDPTKASAGK